MNEKTRRPNRVFTPEQKYEILKDIEKYPTIREGLQKHNIAPSVYHRWKRQLTVGINASLRNTRPLKELLSIVVFKIFWPYPLFSISMPPVSLLVSHHQQIWFRLSTWG